MLGNGELVSTNASSRIVLHGSMAHNIARGDLDSTLDIGGGPGWS